MYRISVTSLEKFRRFVAGASPFDTEESLLDTLSGEFKGNEYTFIGTAFHNIVEQGEAAYTFGADGIRSMVDGTEVIMSYEQAFTALRYRYRMPEAIYEVPVGKDYLTAAFPIHVTGRADVILGNDVRDIKTKYSAPKAEEYMESCQWRFYLEMFNADRFVFDVFEFRGYDKSKHGTDVRGLELRPFDPIECIRYTTMQEDNQKLVSDFCDYIDNKKLHHLLKQKQE